MQPNSRIPLLMLAVITICPLAWFPASLTATCTTPIIANGTYPNADLLINATDLDSLITRNTDDFIIIDMRSVGFNEEHIPGALSIPGPGALADPDHAIQNFMMNAEQFSELMGNYGITNKNDIVIYDEGESLGATRLFYALELYGHQGSVKIVNGGFKAWKFYNLPVVSGQTENVSSVTYNSGLVKERVCDVAYISERIGSDDFILFDARSADEYEGRDRRAARGGHIPGAVNIEWSNFIAANDLPVFLPGQEIATILMKYGITPDKEVIPYCQSNVRGAHVYFTLRLMGYDSVRPYEGSWTEYGNLENAAIE